METVYDQYYKKSIEIMCFFVVHYNSIKIVEYIYDFLVTKEYDENVKNEFPKLNLESMKSFMILDMASSYYEYILYLESIKLLERKDEIFKEYFEETDFSQIKKDFFKNKNISIHIIKRFLDYHFSNYVIKDYCLKLVVENKKLDLIRKLNPLAILKYKKVFDENFITDYEMNIKVLTEIYNIELSNSDIKGFGIDFFSQKESLPTFDEDEYEELDGEEFEEDPIDKIYENVSKKYIELQTKNGILTLKGKKNIGYIIGKVIESIEYQNINNMNLDPNSNRLLNILNNLDFEDAIEQFIDDVDFASSIIEEFLTIYREIDFFEARDIYNSVKKSCKTKSIEKYNYYYQNEQLKYK